MKKLVSVLIAIVLTLSVVSALATEINWSDLQEQGAELIAKGDFVTFDEIAVKMWMPTAFTAVELSDEDREEGYIAYYMTEDETAAVAVVYVNADAMDLETYKTVLTENGATEIEDVTVNGLPAVSYVLEDSDTACITFTTEAGYLFEVSVAPKSDEGFAAVAAFVMASIQPE